MRPTLFNTLIDAPHEECAAIRSVIGRKVENVHSGSTRRIVSVEAAPAVYAPGYPPVIFNLGLREGTEIADRWSSKEFLNNWIFAE